MGSYTNIIKTIYGCALGPLLLTKLSLYAYSVLKVMDTIGNKCIMHKDIRVNIQ